MADAVRVTVKSMNGQFASEGVFLEDSRELRCPRLRPTEVVELPADHPCVGHPALEVTRKPVTRPFLYESEHAATMAVTRRTDTKELQRLQMLQGALSERTEALEERLLAVEGAGDDERVAMETKMAEEQASMAAAVADSAGTNRRNQHTRDKKD